MLYIVTNLDSWSWHNSIVFMFSICAPPFSGLVCYKLASPDYQFCAPYFQHSSAAQLWLENL